MIKLIFSEDLDFNNVITIDNIPNCDYCFDLKPGTDVEFINHNIKNLIFEKFYEEASIIDFTIYKFFKIEINNLQMLPIRQIKSCNYRIIGYSYGDIQYEEREVLSFKFIPDNKFKIIDEIVYCDNLCPHYNNNYCNKYKTEINKGKICRMCYLSINIPLQNQLKLESYMRCQNQI